MHPLLILLIGIMTIVILILTLRVNAFLALIVAAMVVSLLAPGDLTRKIARVAEAFGAAVGSIGIVIALAAIVGRCLMDSGAADRIVRSFLGVLGERRASWALMGSGFILSIPVFYDTVFYLLIPLARSLWRRTRANYVLYTLAIVAGAGISHTLAPPTPGPLFMANALGINLGVMIAMGIAIGFPAAAISLLVCHAIDRRLNLPMRPYSGQAESEPPADSELPGLGVSLAPIVLPVALISLNTMAQTTKSTIDNQTVFTSPIFWIGNETWRVIAGVIEIIGNPNFALLVSAVIALVVLARSRGLSLQQLSNVAENALMSGGVIILITAGGGAFGAMLRNAGIQEWIQPMIGEGGQGVGWAMLLIGFAVAVLMKFAQGSGTVSMITTVTMMASFGVSPEVLGFHPVYLAMAIGCGSLVLDWMNNSGFWIFARMGVFTEVETLQSYTIVTASLGIVGFTITVLYAKCFPLV